MAQPPRTSASAPPASGDVVPPRPQAPPTPPRWLLFVHQLPAQPSNLRVRTWRRLQQLGALAVKQAVYVLPDSPSAREDFEWLKAEIEANGGEASVFAAATVDAWSDDAIVQEFRRSRQEGYGQLARDIERLLKRLESQRRQPAVRAPSQRRALVVFRQRLEALERIDFFGSAGHDRARTLLDALERRMAPPGAVPSPTDHPPRVYRGRLWVTRPRPGIDRMSSAWLIQRFIDREARFGFVADREAAPVDAIPFDMFGVAFTHQGEQCTFERLCSVFDIADAAVARIAAVVHDLDLKDGRFGAPEAPAIGQIIEGLQLAYDDDHDLLAQGMVLFEALYRAAARSTRAMRPRAVARPRRTR